MFKIIGSVIVLLSATLFGMKKYSDFFERKKTLLSLRDGSIQIENSLRCTCAPLHESFLCGGDFFISAAEKISGDSLPAEAVKETAQSLHIFKEEDIRIIERFAEGLCAGDCKGQLANINLFIKGLEGQISNASSELDTRGKLYVKGSILAAAAVVLLLI